MSETGIGGKEDREVPRHRSEASSHVIKCRFVVSAVTYPHFIVPTKATAFIKAPFINLEMNEMGIGCWGGHFQI